MQTFAKKKIALAVGSALLVTAGAAQAAAPVYLASAAQPTMAVGGTALASGLYTTAGVGAGSTVQLGILIDTAATGLTDASFRYNTATAADNDLTITAGGTLIPLANLTNSVGAAGGFDIGVITTATGAVVPDTGSPYAANAAIADAIAAGVIYRVEVTLAPTGTQKVRINNTNGQLEFSTDGTTFNPVIATVLKSTGAGGVLSDNTGAGAIPLAAKTVVSSSAFVLTPTVKTHAAAGAALINGVTVDLKHPVTAPTKATLQLWDRAVAPLANAVDITNAATTGITVPTFTAVAGTAASYDVVMPDPTKVDWDNSGTIDAADAALYVSQSFNTGVNGASSPLQVKVPAVGPAYTNIFNPVTGVAATVATGTLAGAAVANADDGAVPVVTSATYTSATGTTDLVLTISEPMETMGTAGGVSDDLREIAENVFLGTDSIAALNLNAGGSLSVDAGPGDLNTGAPVAIPLVGTTNTSALTIHGLQASDVVGKTVTVTTGMSLKESSDPSFSATVPALDNVAATGPNGVQLAGGIKSVSGAVEGPSVNALASTQQVASLTWGTGISSASCATLAADPTKIGTCIVSFKAGDEVKVNGAAVLAGNIVVTVSGNALAGNPAQFQFIPTAAQLSLNATGSALTITLPTALIYTKLATLTGVNVQYTAAGATAKTLVKFAAPATPAATDVVAAGNLNAVLPLAALATSDKLVTMSVSGTLTGASNGSLVHAYLAKWTDKPTTATSVTIGAGKISNPGDKVATDLAIQYGAGQKVALQTALANSLNNAKAAVAGVPGVSNASAAVAVQPVTAYVMLVRSNDTQANTKGFQNYLEARAILSTSSTDAAFTANGATGAPAGATDVNPVYQVQIDPSTGVISGRLTGNLSVSKTTGVTASPGVTVLGQVAQGLVDATGKFNLIAGVEPTTADLASKTVDKFLILVHEDQNNARTFTQLTSANNGAVNFLPFTPDINRAGTRVVLGVAPGVAAPTVGTTAAVNIDLSKYQVDTLVSGATATNWQLMKVGTVVGANAVSVPRSFVGLDNTGAVVSFWAGDTFTGDMALAMAGNKVGLATELTSEDTLNTISGANFVAGSAALAFANDANPGAGRTLTFAQGPAVTAKAPVGWSLVNVPAGGTFGAAVDAVLRVGAQAASTVTWFKADGAAPALTAGEPVFVFSKTGGNL